jgi:hypothetical protein
MRCGSLTWWMGAQTFVGGGEGFAWREFDLIFVFCFFCANVKMRKYTVPMDDVYGIFYSAFSMSFFLKIWLWKF